MKQYNIPPELTSPASRMILPRSNLAKLSLRIALIALLLGAQVATGVHAGEHALESHPEDCGLCLHAPTAKAALPSGAALAAAPVIDRQQTVAADQNVPYSRPLTQPSRAPPGLA